ncbi:MAG: ATP phosphoribosyltransferase regulatory subunit [Tepidanaerobacteraceae bacterium]|nr:ATP phosphoribosyltransferase regulatory subunit [Tepidanaerobacteraceae bacterium]
MTKYFRRPAGVKDYLPPEVRKKRRIENIMGDILGKWGYEEVIAPSFEYLDTFVASGKPGFAEKVFKFFDRQGGVMALRPDITTSIARMVATHYSDHDTPLRFCYMANVFRFRELRKGRDQEFYQTGAELIGIPGIEADIEIILLASRILKEIGIKDFIINVGHIKFLEGLLDEIDDAPSLKDKIAQAIKDKNFVLLESLIETSTLKSKTKKTFLALPQFYGGPKILDELIKFPLNEKCREAISELERLWRMLKGFNNVHLTFDPGLARGMDYYTGIVFEIYSPQAGFPMGGGGRYDTLLDKFNGSRPATGFALTEEVILSVLERDMKDNYEPHYLYYTPAKYIEAFHKAEEMRKQGYTVKMVPSTNTGAKL